MTLALLEGNLGQGHWRKREIDTLTKIPAGWTKYNTLIDGSMNTVNKSHAYVGTKAVMIDQSSPASTVRNRRRWMKDGTAVMFYDLGGPVYRREVVIGAPTCPVGPIQSGTITYSYQGFLYPSAACAAMAKDPDRYLIKSWPDEAPEFSVSQLIAMGVEGVNRCLPDVPPFNLSQYLGEAMESMAVPGSSVLDYAKFKQLSLHRRAMLAKWYDLFKANDWKQALSGLGAEYLGTVFGIAPSVGMMQDLLITGELEQEFKVYRETDCTRPVRRRRTLLKSSDHTRSYESDVVPYPSVTRERGDLTIDKYVERDVSVSAQFNYRPALAALSRGSRSMSDYLGFGLDADTLWELTSFSWLADYFLNIGTQLNTLSHMKRVGVGLDYSYLTARTKTTMVYNWQGKWHGQLYRTSWTVTATTWQRIKALPYGMVVDKELSPKQLAILAALGLTHLR